MTNASQQIVAKAWNFAHVLRDDGLSYMAYTEQITFLLFLKMADELTKPPHSRPAIVPAKYGWERLLKLDGDELEAHYRHSLEELGKQPGGAGETVRRNLLKGCEFHTLLRLPTGIFYAQGVKANVLFFDAKPAQEKPWTETLWVYDLRMNMHFTQKTNPLKRSDLDEFVECYRPGKRHLRKPTWAEATPEGRWRSFDHNDLMKRDKVNLDIFWLRDKSLEDSEDLPPPDELAQEVADDLETALEQFRMIAEKVKG